MFCREKNIPIIWVRQEFIEIIKRYNAFYRIGLDEILQSPDISKVIIASINTHACVRITTIDSYQRDMEVILTIECTGSYDENCMFILSKE